MIFGVIIAIRVNARKRCGQSVELSNVTASGTVPIRPSAVLDRVAYK